MCVCINVCMYVCTHLQYITMLFPFSAIYGHETPTYTFQCLHCKNITLIFLFLQKSPKITFRGTLNFNLQHKAIFIPETEKYVTNITLMFQRGYS